MIWTELKNGKILDAIMEQMKVFKERSSEDVVAFSIMLGVLFIFIMKSIYGTYIEQVLMNSKERGKVIFFKMLVFIFLFSIMNFMVVTDKGIMILGIMISIIGLIFYFIYSRKEKNAKEDLYEDETELEYFKGVIEYYKRNKTIALLAAVMGGVSGVLFLVEGRTIRDFSVGVILILSTVEVGGILLCMPDILNQKSCIYFWNKSEKIFVYKRVEDSILCGDSPDINAAKVYINIECVEFKKKEIIHERYNNISKKRERELVKEYESRKKHKINRMMGFNKKRLR